MSTYRNFDRSGPAREVHFATVKISKNSPIQNFRKIYSKFNKIATFRNFYTQKDFSVYLDTDYSNFGPFEFF